MNGACLVCGHPTTFWFEKKTFRIRRCGHCGLMGVENVPDDLRPYYSEGYFTGDLALDGYMDYEADKEVATTTYRKYVDLIAKKLGTKKCVRLFEVGCATGFFLELARRRGWQVSGIDLSEYAVAKARDKGFAVTADSLDTYQSTETVDVIAMYDVIEHVKDPVAELKKIKSLLSPGGLLVLTTPDAGSGWAKLWGTCWHAFVPPQHLFYFSQKNLTQLLVAQGFEVVYTGHHGKSFSIPYIFRLLYSWTGLGLWSKLANWSSQNRLKNVSVHLNVRDTLFLIARRSGEITS